MAKKRSFGRRADPTHDIQAPGGQVAPEQLARLQGLIAVLGSQVGQSGREIRYPHSVADDLGLLANGDMRLAVLVCLWP
jgi:hypothetical protein